MVVLKDIKASHLEALLSFMYIGEVDVKEKELGDIISAAECLRIKGLVVSDENPPKIQQTKPQNNESSDKTDESLSNNNDKQKNKNPMITLFEYQDSSPKSERETLPKSSKPSSSKNDHLFGKNDQKDVIPFTRIKEERDQFVEISEPEIELKDGRWSESMFGSHSALSADTESSKSVSFFYIF